MLPQWNCGEFREVCRKLPARCGMALGLGLLLMPALAAAEEIATKLNTQLAAGNLAAAATELEATLAADAGNDQARFGLGAVQFLQTVEFLGQSLYRFGVGNDFKRSLRNTVPGGVPFLRLPVPPNPNPEKFTKQAARQTLQTIIDKLQKADTTLAAVKSDTVKLPLKFGLIRMDLNGDGKAEDAETLWKIYAALNRGVRLEGSDVENFIIGFDRGDVDWLRGYSHLLMGLAELILTYDAGPIYDIAAPLFFPNVETTHPFLQIKGNEPFVDEIADAIALIHSFKLPVKEPERAKRALAHLQTMMKLSRSSWVFIVAETDNDHEWLPNPSQTGVIPNVRVTQDMIAAWGMVIDETEAILAGKKLVPHYRIRDGRGINLNKAFNDPPTFDLVMWMHGIGVVPYLENGPKTDAQTWNRISRVFQGEFIGFAFWFN